MTSPTPKELSKTELQAAVESIPHWFHSIDLGRGVFTPGDKSAAVLEEELSSLHLPDLQGKSVLDIGAWDGFYSWAAERLGADRVVSLDHFVWMIDRQQATKINETWRKNNLKPVPYEQTEAWKPDQLPGKRGYDLSHEVLKSRAECVVADFLDVDVEVIGGPFDIVLFLGVLYHIRNPVLALEKVVELTRELAVIETEAVEFLHYPDLALSEFYERDELGADYTNWWCLNKKALVGLCRAAGFDRVEVLKGAPEIHPHPTRPETIWRRVMRVGGNFLREFDLLPPLGHPEQPSLTRYRAVLHAWK